MPRSGFAGSLALFFLVCGTSILVSVLVALIYVPTSSVPASPAFAICRLFDDGYSDCCELIPHCSFDLRFPDI